MNEHICAKEADIALLHEKMDYQKNDIKRILRLLEGNGQKGLIARFYEFRLYTIVMFVIIGTGGIGSGTLFFNLLKGLLL